MMLEQRRNALTHKVVRFAAVTVRLETTRSDVFPTGRLGMWVVVFEGHLGRGGHHENAGNCQCYCGELSM